jgi:hypothetical protein
VPTESEKQEAEQYFQAMEALFSSQGWKLLADDIKGWQEAIAAQWRSLRPDQLQFEQGRAAAFDQVIKHFEMCESLKAQDLEEHDNTETEEVDV